MGIKRVALLIWMVKAALSNFIETTCARSVPSPSCKLLCHYYYTDKIDEQWGFIVYKFDVIYQQSVRLCDEKMVSEHYCEKAQEMDACIKADYISKFQECASHTKFTLDQLKPHKVLPTYVSYDKACYQCCIYRQFKITSQMNRINVRQLQIHLKNGKKAKKTLKMCQKGNYSRNPCVKVVQIVQCVQKIHSKTYDKYEVECIKSLKMTTDENGLPSLTDPKWKCIIYCVFRKLSIIDATGQYSYYNFNFIFTPAAKVCDNQIKQTDKCLRAVKIRMCLWPELVKQRTKCEIETNMTWHTAGTFPWHFDLEEACYFVCLYKYYNFLNQKEQVNTIGLQPYLKSGYNASDIFANCSKQNAQVRNKCARLVRTMYCVKEYFFKKFHWF